MAGRAPGLAALFRALAAQTLQPRRLVAVVESEADPAHALVRELAPSCPFPVELRVAGHVPWRGQKNTNLLAGLAAVDAEDDAVVLLDADILPQPWWLSALASPAMTGEYHVVTGFRWQLLHGRGLVGHAVAFIDRMAAVLVLPPRFGLVWGGSVGLSRRALAVLDLPRLLDRALVDDLTIGEAAKRHGLRFLARGALVVPTPAEDGGARAQWAFLRRQIQVVRICQPGFWCCLMAMAHLSALGWLAALLSLPDPRAAAMLLGLSGFGALRAAAARPARRAHRRPGCAGGHRGAGDGRRRAAARGRAPRGAGLDDAAPAPAALAPCRVRGARAALGSRAAPLPAWRIARAAAAPKRCRPARSPASRRRSAWSAFRPSSSTTFGATARGWTRAPFGGTGGRSASTARPAD